MNSFWIIGIIVNLTLTCLAIYWVLKQVRSGRDKAAADSERQEP